MICRLSEKNLLQPLVDRFPAQIGGMQLFESL